MVGILLFSEALISQNGVLAYIYHMIMAWTKLDTRRIWLLVSLQ